MQDHSNVARISRPYARPDGSPKLNSGLRRCTLVTAVALLLSALTFSPAGAQDKIKEQRERVAQAEAALKRSSQRLSLLLKQIETLEQNVGRSSAELAVIRLRLARTHRDAGRTQASLNARAREAYKRGAWRQSHFVFGLENLRQVRMFSRYMRGALAADAAAYKEMAAVSQTLEAERQAEAGEKEALLASQRELAKLRPLAQQELETQQEILTRSRTELAQMEEARRKAEAAAAARKKVDSGKVVSPAVAAKRAARQLVLDERLRNLLAWYAPASGDANFVPPKLKGTGAVSTVVTSWYGPGFHGRRASSGATYDQEQTTAASLVLPFGTLLKVTYQNRSVVVVITDRGPYIAGRGLDLSKGAADALGIRGVKEVKMEILVPKEPAPPFP